MVQCHRRGREAVAGEPAFPDLAPREKGELAYKTHSPRLGHALRERNSLRAVVTPRLIPAARTPCSRNR